MRSETKRRCGVVCAWLMLIDAFLLFPLAVYRFTEGDVWLGLFDLGSAIAMLALNSAVRRDLARWAR